MVAFIAIGNAQLAGNCTRAVRHRQLEHDFATIHLEIKEEEREGERQKIGWTYSRANMPMKDSHADGEQSSLLRTAASHPGRSEAGGCDSKILNAVECRNSVPVSC